MDVKTVGVVGTGVIGASWTAFYLARGFEVRATDPADGAEGRLRELVASYWPTLEKLGLSSTASQKRLTFSKNVTEVLSGVDFVQENGPERLDLKTPAHCQHRCRHSRSCNHRDKFLRHSDQFHS